MGANITCMCVHTIWSLCSSSRRDERARLSAESIGRQVQHILLSPNFWVARTQVCVYIVRSYRWQRKVRSKTMASVKFLTTWHVEASGHLDYFGWAVWRNFMVLLCFVYVWILANIHSDCSRDDCKAFSCATSAVLCGLKNFTWPSIGMRVSR